MQLFVRGSISRLSARVISALMKVRGQCHDDKHLTILEATTTNFLAEIWAVPVPRQLQLQNHHFGILQRLQLLRQPILQHNL